MTPPASTADAAPGITTTSDTAVPSPGVTVTVRDEQWLVTGVHGYVL